MMSISGENGQSTAISCAAMETPLVDSDSDDGILSGYSLPTLPELTASSEEQRSMLTRSQYAMVVFHGVADTYPTDSDIVCRYSLTDGVEAAPGDRVVLFAVGWSSIKDYVVFEWAPIPEKDVRDLTVVFKASDLPKDVSEFYQVCYVSNEGKVCGASVPFQVRTPNNEELTFALEDDMLVVRSSTAVAQDKLLKAQLDRENLNKKKVNLEKQMRSLEDKHSLTLRRLDLLQETLSTSNAVNEELKKENTRLMGMDEQILSMEKQSEELQSKLYDADQANKSMQRDIEALTTAATDHQSKIHHLEENIEDLANKLTAANKQIETLQGELKTSQRVCEESERSRLDLGRTYFVLDNDLTVCKFNLNNAQVENLRLKTELEDLVKDNTKLDAELKQAKQPHEFHRSSCKQFSSTNDDSQTIEKENRRLRRAAEDMQLRIDNLEIERFSLEQILEDIVNTQKNVPDDCTLEKRVAQLQYRLKETTSKEQVVQERQSSSHMDEVVSLTKQVETLTRLLDDSLKENEFHLQENMALRLQIESLELKISKDASKLEEYVVVTSSDSSGPIPHSRTAESQQYELERRSEDFREQVRKLRTENAELKQRLADQQKFMNEKTFSLNEKETEIQRTYAEVAELRAELLSVKTHLNLEISKQTLLAEQEVQSRELRNKMQKMSFMNEELLIQNESLMERIHDRKVNNTAEKTENPQNVDDSLSIENNDLKRQLETVTKQLHETRKEVEALRAQMQDHGKKPLHPQQEPGAAQAIDDFGCGKCLLPTQQHDMILERLSHLNTETDAKCHHECCAEPKLKQISQIVQHVLLAMQKLATCSEMRSGEQPRTLDAEELKYRLELAREEYVKLQAVLIRYQTKYNELKMKYRTKKAVMIPVSQMSPI